MYAVCTCDVYVHILRSQCKTTEMVTCIYMTYGILTTSPTKLPSIVHGYLPPRNVPVSTSSSRSVIYANHKYDVVDEPEENDDYRLDDSYLHPGSRATTVSLSFKDEIPKAFDKTEKIVSSMNQNRGRFPPRSEKFFDISSKSSSSIERHLLAPVRSRYNVEEEAKKEEDYAVRENTATDYEGSPAYLGKNVNPTKPYQDSQDITSAIKFLDRFLSRTLNGDSYNNELHPPTNPVLALVLSRYGRYVSGPRNPRLYSYMAVNNIHNNRPFGRYKQECEEEPRYVSSR
ncbi:uncharacterized protein LOC124953509 isoform X1 [Vespa velutina]|uniref:uncharacterized protein LOC124953509 isoform X1 n=1 Tax=Vespa velutina TaxID=202808 RepID=UPI001FB50010|nr:uncharacterized protein LOC124953509 isoform X1 [Vespa velutina]